MYLSQVKEDIYQLNITVDNILFEGLWEIPKGVSVSSYIVKGEKTALIDGVCGWDGVPEKFFSLLDQLKVKLEDVDYLVINHMEPDHSGWMEQLRAIKPDFTIVCTKSAQQLLESFYGHVDNITVVKDGDHIDLGAGRKLTFYTTPNVHWPDAMVTYEEKSATLFSCDVFGSFGIFSDRLYDDGLSAEEMAIVKDETTRYYSNIIGAFNNFVIRSMSKLAGLQIETIAPGHGLVWRENPKQIIELYEYLMNCQLKPNEAEVVMIYGSMYGMTEKAVNYAKEILKGYDMSLKVHRVPEDSWGTLLNSAWTAAGIILAMPTYENKMFPPMAAALTEFANKKVLNKKLFRFGSYGWGGGAEKELANILEEGKLQWEQLPAVEFKGSPVTEDLLKIKAGLEALMEKLGREKIS